MMVSTDDRLLNADDPEETVNDLLTYAELLNTPELAKLYIYVLRDGPVSIEAVKTDSARPKTLAGACRGRLLEPRREQSVARGTDASISDATSSVEA